MTRPKLLAIIILSVIFCSLAYSVFADETSVSYPQSGAAQLQEGATAKDRLVNYIKYIHTISIVLIGVAAVVAIVIGGFMYMLSDSVFSKDEGKRWIFGAVSGLILALASYLILYTINPELVGLSAPTITTPSSPSTPGSPTPSPGSSSPTPGTGPGTVEADEYDENTARSLSKELCSDGSDCVNKQPPATTLAGVKKDTMAGIKALKDACGCDIVITAGTESGHGSGTYSHGNGYKLDIRSSSNANSYITGNFKKGDKIGSFDTYYTTIVGQDGITYYVRALDERTRPGQPHWDIRITTEDVEI